MLHPILNRFSPVPTRTRINLLKMYNIVPILMYAGAAWAHYVSKNQWRQLEAVRTITARTIFGTPSYVRNEITFSTAKLTKFKILIGSQAPALFHKNRLSRYRHIRELGHLAPAIHPRLRLRPKSAWATESINI